MLRALRSATCCFALAAAPAARAADSGPDRGAGAKPELLLAKLAAALEAEDRALDGVLGVAILDLAGGRSLLRNADEVFPAASSIKIAVLAELYRQEAQARAGVPGQARLADLYTLRAEDLVDGSPVLSGLTPGATRLTHRDLATLMIAVSDNAATNVLIERVGLEGVNGLLAGLGLEKTRLRRRMMDLAAAREGRENTSTPRELASLLQALHAGRVVSGELLADLLDVLDTPNDGSLARLLPGEVRVAHKPGALEAVRTDSGIVFAEGRPFAISVMTSYLRDERAGEDAIARIALAAWRCFDRLGRASPLGRVISPR
jgi:beta-lactamase class A